MNRNLFPKDFKDILLTLEKYDVEFLLVGAWALGAHGLPRATADMVKNKKATGRPKDIEDVKAILKKYPNLKEDI